MVFEKIIQEEAGMVGDPEDASPAELSGEAPLCDDCGERQAVQPVGRKDLCEDCKPDHL